MTAALILRSPEFVNKSVTVVSESRNERRVVKRSVLVGCGNKERAHVIPLDVIEFGRGMPLQVATSVWGPERPQ